MNAHAQRLIAAGIDPQTAIRDQWADDMRQFGVWERYQDAAAYAREQEAQEPIHYEMRRGV